MFKGYGNQGYQRLDKKGYTAKILSRRPKHKLRTEYDEIAAGGQCPILKY
jgi:hypothetical protein